LGVKSREERFEKCVAWPESHEQVMVVEEIKVVKKKPNFLHQETGKIPEGISGTGQMPSIVGSEGVKV
jgi:hypothetical protein